MDINKYSTLALRTAKSFGDDNMDLMHAAAGMAGESGEVIDVVKKVVFYGKPVDRKHLIEELGDVMWYCNLLAHKLDVTWGEVFETNIRKLEARYPNLRFDAEHAINRNKEAEAAAINGVV